MPGSLNNENRHLLCNSNGHPPCSLLFIVCWMKIAYSLGRAQIRVLLMLVWCLELTVTAEPSSHTPFLSWVENSHKHAEKGLQESGGSSMKISRKREGWYMPGAAKIMPCSSSSNEAASTLRNMPTLHVWHFNFGFWKRLRPEQELSEWNCTHNWTKKVVAM